MLDVIIKDVNFRKMLESHCRETLGYLLEKEQQCSVLCYIKYVKFDPELPSHILEGFNDITLFVLSNYTLQSAKIDGDYVTFEAGFGPENVGSVVSLPLFAIIQIIVSDNVLFLNPAANTPIVKKANVDKDAERNSIEAILSNPKNSNLLKKLK
jgi:hypothetical protein